MRWFRWSVSLCVIIASVHGARGQQYGFTQYTPKEGLAQSQVRCIGQDGEGYLWLGTLGGASRFDGSGFTNYALQEGLPDAQVNALLGAHDGTLWLGVGGSLVEIKGKQRKTVPLPASAHEARVLSLAETIQGELLVGTDGAGAFIMQRGTLVPLPGYPSDTASTVRALLAVPDGGVVLGTKNGAYRWQAGICSAIRLGTSPVSIGALALGTDGTIWIGTYGDGLYALRANGDLIGYDEEKGLVQNTVRALLVDRKGRVWAGTKFGISVVDGERLRSFTVHQGMPSDNVWCLFQDQDGGIWIGTDGAGVLRFAGDRFVTLTVQEGLCSDLVMAMTTDVRGDLWLGTYGNGICRRDGQAVISTLDGSPNNTIWSALGASDSSLWFGTSAGLCHVRNGRVLPLDSARSLRGLRVLALHEDPDGSLWCGTREGLAVIGKDGQVRWVSEPGSSLLRSVRAIAEARAGHYLATDQGLALAAPEGLQHWTVKDGLCDNTVQCLLVDSKERVWVGTTNGLACLDHGKLTNLRLGADFGSNYIDLLLGAGDGHVWAGTNNGLFRFVPDSLLARPSSAEHFSTADGLRGMECNLNAAFKDNEGRLFFGTNAGLVVHDPARGPARAPAPLPIARITGIRSFMMPSDWKGQSDSIDARSGLPLGLHLAYRKNHLTFDFTAVALADAERLRFQYRLLGFDPGWSPPAEARFASFSNLPQGDYAFEIRASHSEGQWGPITRFTFRISPPFWLRWWFFVLCAAVLAGLAVLIARVRALRRERQEKTRQLMLRSRMLQLEQQALNANMNRHFIFNALNSIQFYINRQDRAAANRYLTSFAKLIRKNLDASRTDTTSLAEEIDRLELYLVLEHMRFKDKFTYHIQVDPAVDTHTTELPAMMLQPYVENSIWHGILPTQRQGQVTIDVRPGIEGHVRISITDDGIGVEESLERKNGRASDHISRGIEITKGRADVLRRLALADIRIQGPEQTVDSNGQPSGTAVTIELPSKKSAPMADLHLQQP